MIKPKNKNGSSSFHTSRTRIKSSHIAHTKKLDRKIFKSSKRAVLTVIALAMLTVILTVLLSILSSPEHVVKTKISEITTDYYENYFYPHLTESDTPLDETMSHYTEVGFSRVSLRQLLLFDSERYAGAASTITAYCDENETFIQIYPEPPFSSSDYRIDYHYACIF